MQQDYFPNNQPTQAQPQIPPNIRKNQDGAPLCNCGFAIGGISNSAKNAGKGYWKCGNSQQVNGQWTGGCNFFMWEDGTMPKIFPKKTQGQFGPSSSFQPIPQHQSAPVGGPITNGTVVFGYHVPQTSSGSTGGPTNSQFGAVGLKRPHEEQAFTSSSDEVKRLKTEQEQTLIMALNLLKERIEHLNNEQKITQTLIGQYMGKADKACDYVIAENDSQKQQ